MLKLKRIFLYSQDLIFLKYIHAVKIATYEQIQRDCYPEHKVNSVSNRIRKMEANQLVQIGVSRIHKMRYCLVSISKKGFVNFVDNESVMRNELSSDAVAHDLKLVDIRSVLKNLPSTRDYFTENELQTWSKDESSLNSDALIISSLKERKFRIPLEYELNMKAEERYKDLVNKYYQHSQSPFVFFVTKDEKIQHKIVSIEKDLYNWEKPKFFYLNEKEFFDSADVIFQNCRQTQLNLGVL